MSRMVSCTGFACVWFIKASVLCLCTLPSVYGIPRGSDYGSSQPFIGKSSYHIFVASRYYAGGQLRSALGGHLPF